MPTPAERTKRDLQLFFLLRVCEEMSSSPFGWVARERNRTGLKAKTSSAKLRPGENEL